jgi:hypothetical protein
MKKFNIENIVKNVLEESLQEKANDLTNKIKSKLEEWEPFSSPTISAQSSDIHEVDDQTCQYHKEKFGEDDERTMEVCGTGKSQMEESLKGGQKKLDKNKNKKLDSEDFKLLRKSKKNMKESKQVCSECGSGYMEEGVCNECGYGTMEENHDFDFIFNDEIGEQEQQEGNAFTGALEDAKRKHKKSFEVDGKKYPVKESKEKWIQDTDMKKGSLHKSLGVPEGEKLSQSKLKSLKKELMNKAKGDKKLSKSDLKLLKQVNLALTLKDVKESNSSSLFVTESELIDLIESIVKEQSKPKGLAVTDKVKNADKKENDAYLKSVAKKMKDYLKDGSKGGYETNPVMFPKGNGELAKMKKMAYVPDNPTQEYIDNFTAAGQENLVYDEIHPNEEWMEKTIEGSSKTGNNPKWANAVDTGVNKKRNKIRKDNLLGAVKQMAYNKAPQPVIDDSEYGVVGKFNKNFGKGAGKKAAKILNQLESTESTENNLINEEFDKMKHLINYNQKTQ